MDVKQSIERSVSGSMSRKAYQVLIGKVQIIFVSNYCHSSSIVFLQITKLFFNPMVS